MVENKLCHYYARETHASGSRGIVFGWNCSSAHANITFVRYQKHLSHFSSVYPYFTAVMLHKQFNQSL
jgi:hypothetical protein